MLFTQLFESDFNKKPVAEAIDDDYEDCSYCSGTGEGRWEGSTCTHCDGSGVEPVSQDDNDFEDPDGDVADMDSDEESYYEKSLRSRGLGEQGVAEAGVVDAVKKGAKKAWDYATEPIHQAHDIIVKDRAKNIAKIRKNKEQGVAEGLSKGNYNVGLEDIGKPVTVDGESGYVLLSIGYSSGNGKLTAHILQPDTGSKGTYDLETIGKGQQGVAEGSLNEFAPSQGGTGRWYNDSDIAAIVGNGWYEEMDVSGDVPKQWMLQQAQAWLEDQGYSVDVLDCKINDDDMDWYISGTFNRQGVAEAFIPYALSAANANAEFERQRKNRISAMPAGGGYRGRVEIGVESKEDYIATGKTLAKAAKAAGQHIDYGLSDGVMKVFSDSMTTDELDTFIDDTLENFDQGVAEGEVYEFAPPGSNDGDEPDEYEILHRLAAMWWLGTEQQMIKAQRTLASMGWEIGEDEGYDDGGVFVVRANDEHGKSYISWPHEDLQLNEQGMAEAGVGNRMSDMTVGSPKIVHKGGRAVGEIGLDHDPSPGQGPFYMKHYETNTWYSGYDTKKEALDDLKHVVAQMNEGVAEADKKKDEPETRDVALQRAITRAKADFPTAGSGLEALAKDFMRSQDQDQKSLDQLQQAERKQDQMLSQINKIDREQEQEIQDLEQQNSTLAQRLQQLQNVNSQLEKKLASMSGRKQKRLADKSEPVPTIASNPLPAAAAPAPATQPEPAPKSEPTTSRAIGQVAKTLAAPTASPAFDRMSQELQPRQKELGFDEPVTLKPKKYDTSRAADVDYRELTSKLARDIAADPNRARAFKPGVVKGVAGQQEMPVEGKEESARIRAVKRQRADGSVETTYELVNARGVTVKTGMSKDTALSHLKHYKQKYGQ